MNKRKYSKPEIFFDDFSLSTNIAAGCEVFPIDNAAACGVSYWRAIIFTEPIGGCLKKVENDDPRYDSICYHNPSDNNVFNS